MGQFGDPKEDLPRLVAIHPSPSQRIRHQIFILWEAPQRSRAFDAYSQFGRSEVADFIQNME